MKEGRHLLYVFLVHLDSAIVLLDDGVDYEDEGDHEAHRHYSDNEADEFVFIVKI